jgi:DUF2933 family protein
MKPETRNRRLSVRGWFRSPAGLAALSFLGVAAFLLLVEHRSHVFGALPYVLLLACPLLHFFGHGSHSKHSQ